MIARVLGVIAASAAAGDRQKVTGSMSAKIGVAPTLSTQEAVAKKLKEGMIDPAAWPRPCAIIAAMSEVVPLLVATACLAPW